MTTIEKKTNTEKDLSIIGRKGVREERIKEGRIEKGRKGDSKEIREGWGEGGKKKGKREERRKEGKK